MKQVMKLELDSISSNESFARVVVAAFLTRLNPTMEEVADIKTAVSEAVTNCIVHAYENRDNGEIELVATYTQSGKLTIVIKDRGRGIENIELARHPLYTTDKENERSGMGFSIMETFSDKLMVSSKPGKGTKITIVKQLEKRK